METLSVQGVLEKKINIEGIPTILLCPRIKRTNTKTIIFYHGWSSNKEKQRLRGHILASLGYQVLIPDSIYHGERGNIKDYSRPVEVISKFWPTVITSMNESEILIEYIVDVLGTKLDNIGVTGNSMGGMITAGILANNDDINTGVIINGSCNWKMTNEIVKDIYNLASIKEIKIIENLIEDLDPVNRLDEMRYKNILLQHGACDSIVDINPQITFYNRIKRMNPHTEFIIYERLDHFVTTNMIEEMIYWFDEHL